MAERSLVNNWKVLCSAKWFARKHCFSIRHCMSTLTSITLVSREHSMKHGERVWNVHTRHILRFDILTRETVFLDTQTCWKWVPALPSSSNLPTEILFWESLPSLYGFAWKAQTPGNVRCLVTVKNKHIKYKYKYKMSASPQQQTMSGAGSPSCRPGSVQLNL